MRLAQIARKLDVKTSAVVTFIEQKFDEQIVNAPNTKIPDEYVKDIIDNFSVQEEVKIEKEIPAKTTAESPEETEPQEIKPKETTNNQAIEELEKKNPIEEEQATEISNTDDEAQELNIEDGVIKIPKVEVRGLKVVGKIDLPGKKTEEPKTEEDADSKDSVLPEPEKTEVEQDSAQEKKPEEVEKPESTEEETALETPVKEEKPVEQEKKPVKKKVKKPQANKNKKSLTYEEERNLAQKKYRDELQKKKEIEKKKKKANYERMMKERATKKAPKKSKTKPTAKETAKSEPKKTVQKKEAPTTLWGKFIYWLNN